MIPTESQEAKALLEWANLQPLAGGKISDYLVHIPNEGKRTFSFATKLKREGLKSGVSDYFLAYPVPPYGGLWIELKRRSNRAKATVAQAAWLALMEQVGYAAKICYGWEQARAAIEGYLKAHC